MAEEIVFGKISTGAQNDLERITAMAYAMVVDYGMSERVGYVSFNLSRSGSDGPVFIKPYSDETARIIDEEVRLIIDEVRARARVLLELHADKLESMAVALLEVEVLGPKELVALLGTRPHGDYVDYEGKPPKADASGPPTTDTQTEAATVTDSDPAERKADSNGVPTAESDTPDDSATAEAPAAGTDQV